MAISVTQRGICKNLGNCSIADKKMPISLKEENCPKCGEKLYEVSSHSFISKKSVVIFLIVSGLVGFAGWYYSEIEAQPRQFFSQLFSFGNNESQSERPQSPSKEYALTSTLASQVEENVTYKINEKPDFLTEANIPKCLLSATSEIRKMLPVSRVPRMRGKEIPPSLYKWMKNTVGLTILVKA